jgi:hypothetical protein
VLTAVSDLTGRLQLIGEWANGSLAQNGECRALDMNSLNEIIRRSINEIDLQLLLVGMLAMLGIDRGEERMRYVLEICVPLAAEEGEEFDLELLQRRTSALTELKDMGFYLSGDRGGSVRCYKEGAVEDLEKDLLAIETALAK